MTGRGSFTILSMALLTAMAGCSRDTAEVVDDDAIEAEIAALDRDVPEPEPAPIERSRNPLDDDITYVVRLGVFGGHLLAFVELYRIGDFQSADLHMSHLNDDAYATLAPVIEARGAAGFAGELAQLAQTASQRGNIEEDFTAVALAARQHGPGLNNKGRLFAVSELLAAASEYFSRGVNQDGQITDPVEYQVAYGIVAAARDIVANAQTNDINESEAIAVAHEQIDLLESSFPALAVTETNGDASGILSAANQIERIAARLP